MIVQPDTEIYLIKAPLQIDELHQLDFANETAQVNYFQSLPKLALMNATYQRENELMYVNFNIEKIRSYNYVMYKNKQYSNKWFYAFITGFTYEGNTVTGVSIKTDVFQTYLFEYQLKRSYVKRETVADDTFGKHLLPEDVDTGDYVTNNSLAINYEVCSTRLVQVQTVKTPVVCVQCTEKVGNLYESLYAGEPVLDDTFVVGSLPQGCYYYFFYATPFGYGKFREFRNHLDSIGKGNAIMNVFLAPSRVASFATRFIKMFDGEGHESGTAIETVALTGNTYGVNVITYQQVAIPNKIGNFTPKNNKVLTFPYQYFLISNYVGDAREFHYEDFDSTPNFLITGILSTGSCFGIKPVNSKKSYIGDNSGEQPRYEKINTEYLAGQTLPTLSWDSDYYLNWIAQNGKKLEMQQSQKLGQVIGDTLATGITTGLTAGKVAGVVAGAGTLIGGMVEYEDLVDEINETKRQAEIVPNSVQGNANAGDMVYSSNSVGFGIYNYHIREDIAQKLDRYFDMFGYRVNEIKTPNTKTRRYWNFIQTIGVNITGDIPQEAVIELKKMYNTGLTIWHDPSNFLNYDLTNSIL